LSEDTAVPENPAVPPKSTAELMQNLHDVFNERDADQRRALIAETYTDDVVFNDPDGVTHGQEELNDKAQEILDGAPDFVFALTGPLQEHHGLGVQAWGLGPAGAPPVATGLDVARVHDGLITEMWTFLDS